MPVVSTAAMSRSAAGGSVEAMNVGCVLLDKTVQLGLLRPVALATERDVFRRLLGLQARDSQARLPKW